VWVGVYEVCGCVCMRCVGVSVCVSVCGCGCVCVVHQKSDRLLDAGND